MDAQWAGLRRGVENASNEVHTFLDLSRKIRWRQQMHTKIEAMNVNGHRVDGRGLKREVGPSRRTGGCMNAPRELASVLMDNGVRRIFALSESTSSNSG